MGYQKPAKIGLMGGTFNPVHFAHLILAEQARVQFKLNEVWFMPSGHPPHKPNQEIVSDEHRIRMLELATQSNPYFRIETMELSRSGYTYTAETLKQLKIKYPSYEFYFIIGGDSLETFLSWYCPEEILHLSHVVVAERDQMSFDHLLQTVETLNKTYHADIKILHVPIISLSSKMIREQLSFGSSVRYFLPEQVLSYIIEQNLYREVQKGEAWSDIRK